MSGVGQANPMTHSSPETISSVARGEFAAVVSDELLRSGVVNVIGLDTVKERAGERWDKLHGSIYSRLEAILRRKLRGEDFFARLSPVGYLIAMPGVEREEAQVCCLSITLELHRGLFGSCDLGHIEILAGAPGEADTISFEPIAADQLTMLVRKHRLNEHHQPEDQPRLGAVPAQPASNKGFVFSPLWDPQKEAVIGYRCVPAQGHGGIGQGTGPLRSKVDLEMAVGALRHGGNALIQNVERGDRFFISVPMTYEALSCPLTRMEIASACRAMSNRLRAYLLFEISEIPRGVPAGRLADLGATIRPFCKGLIVHAPFRDRTFAPHAANVAQAIALDLPHGVSAADVRSELDRIRQDAQHLGCISMLSNVATPEFFRYAVSRGVNLISGPLLGMVQAPQPMHRVRASEILGCASHRGDEFTDPMRIAS